MDKQKVPIWQKMNLTIEEAVQYSNIGENTLRKLLKEPLCPFALSVGERKKLVKRVEFEKWNSKEYEI